MYETFWQQWWAIIDGSEIFVETRCDLALQSSTWSSYKHHNTLKFLVACTPNGSISFISPLYLGSVSDPALTRDCGFLEQTEGMPGVSIMANCGFTINSITSYPCGESNWTNKAVQNADRCFPLKNGSRCKPNSKHLCLPVQLPPCPIPPL